MSRAERYKMSQEHKDKISKALKGRMPKNFSQIKGWNKGKSIRHTGSFKNGHRHSEEIRYKISESLKGRKLSKKHKENIGLSIRGNKNPWYGKNLSEEHKKKLSDAHVGKIHLGSFKKGKNHHNWKGGITPLIKLVRSKLKYADWRLAVFENAGFKCEECGIKNRKGLGKTVRLEAHHIIPIHKIMQDHEINTMSQALNCSILWDISNGRCLCLRCHIKLDNYRGRPIKVFTEKCIEVS